MHALLLAAVLFLVLPFTRPGVPYTTDEGAAILQARLLERTGSWVMHDPLASLDPERHARPVPRADEGLKGRAPYAKHPLYPVVLAGADAVAGRAGLVGVAVIGTVLAALAAGLLSRLLRPGLGGLTIWTVGLATPLFFDSFVVLAHTLAAATAGFAVLCAVAALRRQRSPRPGRLVLATVATGLLLVLSAALRTEGAFVGIGVAVAAGAEVIRGRAPLRAAVAIAGVGVASVAAVRLAEATFVHHILGAGVASFEGSQGGGPFLLARWHGLLATWFTPSYRKEGIGDAAVVVAAVVIALIALAVRRRRASPIGIAAAAVLVAVAYIIRAVARPGAIPGLVVAFPIGWAGAWLLDRRAMGGHGEAMAVVGGVTATAVLATQVSIGGGVEWGGRYFAVVLAVVTPALLLAVIGWASDVPRLVSRTAAGVAAVTTLALGATAVRTLAHTHADTDRLLDAVSEAGRHARGTVEGASADRRPVVVSTERLLPQLAWDRYDRFRWLAPHEGDIATYGHRLAAAGVDRFVLVTPDPAGQLRQLGEYRELARMTVRGRVPPVPVLVVQRR